MRWWFSKHRSTDLTKDQKKHYFFKNVIYSRRSTWHFRSLRCSSTVSWQIKILPHKCTSQTAVIFLNQFVYIFLNKHKDTKSEPDFFHLHILMRLWSNNFTLLCSSRVSQIWWVSRRKFKILPKHKHCVEKVHLHYRNDCKCNCQYARVVIFHVGCQNACIARCSDHQQSENGIGENESRNNNPFTLEIEKFQNQKQGQPLNSLLKRQ